MSGVYIPNWEMPKGANDCEFSDEFFTCSLTKERCTLERMGIGCPLVSVPDHGRLIDADAVDYDDYWWNKHYSARDCKQAEKMIKEQPTIIPADKDGET